MSKHNITHSCGHTVVNQVIGTNVNGERDRKIAWLAEQPCNECRRKAKLASEAAATAHLPVLTGTEKQIVWAQSIRAKLVPHFEAVRVRLEEYRPHVMVAADEEKLQNAIAIVEQALNNTESKWWIEHRDDWINMKWVKAAMEL